jgi:hypothetical protein
MTTPTPTPTRNQIVEALRAGATARDVAETLGLDYDAAEGAVLVPGWTADDGQCDIAYPDASTAAEAAEEYVDGGDWGDSGWVTVYTWRVGLIGIECAWCEAGAVGHDYAGDAACAIHRETPEEGASLDSLDPIEVRCLEEPIKVALETPEPDCAEGQEHVWRSPHSVVGGCDSNPGVQGHGGGVIMHEVCRHCGTHRVTDTWAQDMTDGTQGLTRVEYRDADAASRRWVAASLIQSAEWRWTHAPTMTDECALGGDLVTEDGTVLASCLWSDGELDTESDGCVVQDDRLDAADLEDEWTTPSDDEIDAVWGRD